MPPSFFQGDSPRRPSQWQNANFKFDVFARFYALAVQLLRKSKFLVTKALENSETFQSIRLE